MKLFDGKFKIARRCCLHAMVSLKNSLIFITELVILGSRSKSGQAPQAAHYKTYTIFHKVMFQLEARSRNSNSKQETEQIKTNRKEEKLHI